MRQASLLAGLRTEEMAFFSFTRGYLGFQFGFVGVDWLCGWLGVWQRTPISDAFRFVWRLGGLAAGDIALPTCILGTQ